MDNAAIARTLDEIASLLELRGDNPFKIRAYRNGAATVAECGDRVAALAVEQLLALPGIGRDLAARVRELVDTGDIALHRELLAEFPATLLDLLKLQGLGPRTVALLHRTLAVATLDDLERAAQDGRLREIRGLGEKKEQSLLKAIEEQRRFAGRHLLADVHRAAGTVVAWLREAAPDATFDVVGSLRRGQETCGDLDVLVTGAAASIMERFAQVPGVERVLGQGETKSSVRLAGGLQADLRLVAPESRGAAMQYFTGSKLHNIELRDRAIARGLRLNEYGLFRADDQSRVAGETEAGIYEALGLPWIPPELRERRGEFEAAEAGTLPRLLTQADLLGDVHMHTTETDGRDGIEAMVLAARALGHRYVAITDHSQALAMANGLDERRALAHAARIREIGSRWDDITVLAGIECDIRPDGTMDLADDCLAQLDLVIASVHSSFHLDEAQMTDRVLRALANPWVDVLGHPTGRLLLKRPSYRLDVQQVIAAAASHGVAMEINCQLDRLDLGDTLARSARDRGVTLVISTDAHSTGALEWQRWGVAVARRAWLTADDVLNTRAVDEFRAALRRNRSRR